MEIKEYLGKQFSRNNGSYRLKKAVKVGVMIEIRKQWQVPRRVWHDGLVSTCFLRDEKDEEQDVEVSGDYLSISLYF